LAHPLGANFQEFLGMARYQPAPRWLLHAKAIYFRQGKDTGTTSFGGNISLPNVPPFRKMDYGYNVGSGVSTKTGLASLLISYQLRPNLFIEAFSLYRRQTANLNSFKTNTTLFSLGVRWNVERREFDF